MVFLLRTLKACMPVFFALFLLAIHGKGASASSPLFTVEGVQVDVTADNAVQAREKAFAEAQQKAFKVLASRMVADADIDSVEIPPADTISTLVNDYEISNEKLSSVRYVATYKFRFKDGEVRRFFNYRDVEYTDVSRKPALVLPYYQTNGKSVLWDSNNPWRQAWNRAINLEGLVTFIVPLGDLADVRDIPGDTPLEYEGPRLKRVLDRYEASEAVIMTAVPDQTLTAALASDGNVAGTLEIYIYRTDRGVAEYVHTLNIQAGSNETAASLMDRAVDQTQKFLRRDWKKRTAVRSSGTNEVEVGIPLSSLAEWASIQRKLNNVYGIDEVEILSVQPGRANVILSFEGDIERLKLALNQADMVLTPLGYQRGGQPQNEYLSPFERYNRPETMMVKYELSLNTQGLPQYNRQAPVTAPSVPSIQHIEPQAGTERYGTDGQPRIPAAPASVAAPNNTMVAPAAQNPRAPTAAPSRTNPERRGLRSPGTSQYYYNQF